MAAVAADERTPAFAGAVDVRPLVVTVLVLTPDAERDGVAAEDLVTGVV